MPLTWGQGQPVAGTWEPRADRDGHGSQVGRPGRQPPEPSAEGLQHRQASPGTATVWCGHACAPVTGPAQSGTRMLGQKLRGPGTIQPLPLQWHKHKVRSADLSPAGEGKQGVRSHSQLLLPWSVSTRSGCALSPGHSGICYLSVTAREQTAPLPGTPVRSSGSGHHFREPPPLGARLPSGRRPAALCLGTS